MATFTFDWTEEKQTRWAMRRKKGMLHYVVVSSVLPFCVPLILMLIIAPLLWGVPVPRQYALDGLWQNVISGFVLSTLSGVFLWYHFESRFRNYVPKAP